MKIMASQEVSAPFFFTRPSMLTSLFRHPDDSSSDEECCTSSTGQEELIPEQKLSYVRVGTEYSLEFEKGLTSPVRLVFDEDSTEGCGGKHWDAARILCNYILHSKETLFGTSGSGIKILELGAGTGIVSLFLGALLHGQQNPLIIAITDLQYCIDLIHRNILKNFGSRLDDVFKVGELRWGEALGNQWKDHQPFDYIVASECVYHEDFFQPLMSTLMDLMPRNCHTTLLMISKKRRKADKRFFVMMRKEFSIQEVIQ